jgi:hypothetical protein
MTFPAFMSVSTDDSVADDFGDFLFFIFVNVRGARIAALSQLPKEAEILVPPPSVFRIKAVAKVGTTKSFIGGQEVKTGGRLTITLEQEHCPLAYLSHTASKLSGASAAAAASFSSSSSSSSSPAAAAASAAPAAAAEDPDVLALSQSLKALGVGTASACLKFAKVLGDQGVVTMERLKKLSADKVQKVLEKVQMTDIQIETVMEAIAPAPAPAPASEMVCHANAITPCPNSRVFPGCCCCSHCG